MKISAYLGVMIGALALAGCSSSSTGSFDTDGGGGTDGGKTDGGKTDGGGGSDSGGGNDSGSDPDLACASETTQKACVDCCAGNHTAGATVYQRAQNTCVCKAAVCGTECAATLCASTPKNPDQTCLTCANSKLQGSCAQEITAACQADNDCLLFNTCATQTAKCTAKP